MCFLLILIIAVPVEASTLAGRDSVIRITALAPHPLDHFGWSVALDKGMVLVGAPGADNAALFDGRTGARLLSVTSPNSVGVGFGSSVALGDGLMVVGSPLEDSVGQNPANAQGASGNAYVFNASTGVLLFTLTTPHPQQFGLFGVAVSVKDGLVIVGAWGEEKAYVFDSSNRVLLFTLTGSNRQGGEFGFSTSVGSGLIIIGSPFECSEGQIPCGGKTYVFSAHTSELLFTLTDPNPNLVPVYGGEFGWSVGVGANVMVVGAPNDGATRSSFTGPGHAYMFDAHTGDLISQLTGDAGSLQFGYSVSGGRSLIAVGTPSEPVAGHPEAGSVYLFKARTGGLLSTFTSPNPQTKSYFGYSIVLNGDVLVVGAPFTYASVAYPALPGSAYIFSPDNSLSQSSGTESQLNGLTSLTSP